MHQHKSWRCEGFGHNGLTCSQVLVEGPSDEPKLAVPRHAAALKDLSLTGIVIEKLPLATGSGALKKRWAEAKIDEKWTNSGYAKRLQKEARRKQLNDFERFKVMRLRKQVRTPFAASAHGQICQRPGDVRRKANT